MKIYKKRGNKNYKEKRLIEKLKPVLEEKLRKDPNFRFPVATNYDELNDLYTEHAIIEDVEFEETQNNEQNNDKNTDMAKDELEDENQNEDNNFSDIDSEESNQSFVDPFNRKEPIVRDYVFGDKSIDKPNTKDEGFNPNATFDEPQSFDEAFVIPDDEGGDEDKSKKSSPFEKKKSTSSDSKEPLNPNWDEMKGSVQKKKTKKFAKYIVEAVSTLQQKGFVYYANKDINEAKLNEYELDGLMDLSLLVTLENGQEVTVKQFFQNQCQKAEELSHLTQEQKDDITDSLTEVLMEKGAGPTPTQELMLVTLTILGGQALTLMTLKSQTNSLLSQLKVMNEPEQDNYQEPWHQQEQETQQEEQSVPEPEQQPEPVETDENVVAMSKPLEIGETIETKE